MQWYIIFPSHEKKKKKKENQRFKGLYGLQYVLRKHKQVTFSSLEKKLARSFN